MLKVDLFNQLYYNIYRTIIQRQEGIKMEKTVIELFAGVGGFRCGLNNVELKNDKVIENIDEVLWYLIDDYSDIYSWIK